MASEQFEKIRALVEKNQAPFVSAEKMRAALEAVGGPLPAGTTGTEVEAGGVPAEWVDTPDGNRSRVVLYLHGGGYIGGSLWSHHNLIGHLTMAMGCRVLGLDYRLAPENPHPAPVEDALAAYRWLLAEGFEPGQIAVAGDSAGGGLTVALLLAARDAGLPQPAAAVPISPWVDMGATGESLLSRADLDVMVSPGDLADTRDLFLGPDGRIDDPLASPLAGDLSGLAPMLIQVGDHEVLLSDAERLAVAVAAAGGDVTLEVAPEMLHVWHSFAGWAPESDQAIARMAEFLRARLGLS